MHHKHVLAPRSSNNNAPQRKATSTKCPDQSRWRPSPQAARARTRVPHKAHVLDLIERLDLTSFTLYSTLHDAAPQADDDNSASEVPPLTHLCLQHATADEKRFRALLPRLLDDEYLPIELRNTILSAVLAKGFLRSERELKRLLIHPDMEELDFAHPNCRELVNDAFIRQFFPHAPILREMDSWEEITAADLYRSPQGCPRLVRLSLAACWRISAQLLREVLKSFARLSVLDLSGVAVELLDGLRFESPSLTQLILARIRGTSAKFPLRFTLATPALHLLSLRGTPYLGVVSVATVAFGPAAAGGLVGGDVAPASGCLHALDMCGVHLYGSSGPAVASLLELCLHNAATLKVLNLAHTNTKPVLLQRLGSLHEALPDLQLEEVSLAANKNLSTEALVEFMRAFRGSLRLLDLTRCDVHAPHISTLAHSLQPAHRITVRSLP